MSGSAVTAWSLLARTWTLCWFHNTCEKPCSASDARFCQHKAGVSQLHGGRLLLLAGLVRAARDQVQRDLREMAGELRLYCPARNEVVHRVHLPVHVFDRRVPWRAHRLHPESY